MDWEGFFRDYRKPDFIPGYTILNKLGGGVFGDVYKARKTSIGKFYAIKFLKLQDERLSEQVLRELESVDHFAQVDHPNLVSIEDRGDVGGIPFIVMGYAGDETLKTVLRQAPMSHDRAFTLFRQIVQGVNALHEHSIVHFDLKPANIFIKGDVARVGDYGLSKLMSESRGTLSMGRGTPYYMAPEMLRRKGDARSDVYSLGVILYEMIAGDVPFKGDSEWEILKKHETEVVEIPADVPAPLAAFMRQSLDKDPARRFRNAGAQLAALDSVSGERSVSGRIPVTTAASAHGQAAKRTHAPRHAGRRTPSTLGEAAGRLAYRGHVSLDRGRRLVSEILDRLRDGSKDAVQGARRGWSREARLNGGAGQAGDEGDADSHDRRRGGTRASLETRRSSLIFLPLRVLGGALRLVGRVLLVPIRLLQYVFRHLAQVIVVLLILFVLGALIHLGLTQAIL